MGRTDSLEKTLMLGKIEGKNRREWQTIGWHHWLSGLDFEQTLDSEGQGSLVCCRLWGCKESDMTDWLNNNKNFFKTLMIVWGFSELSSFRCWRGLPQCWWAPTDQGGGCWRLGRPWWFLKIRQQWSLMHWLTLPFTDDFSVACSAVWQHLPTELLSKLESIRSKPAAALSTTFMTYSKAFVVISTVFTASSPEIEASSKNYVLCSSIRNSSSFIRVFPWGCSNSAPSSGSTSNSSSLVISPHLYLVPPLKPFF